MKFFSNFTSIVPANTSLRPGCYNSHFVGFPKVRLSPLQGTICVECDDSLPSVLIACSSCYLFSSFFSSAHFPSRQVQNVERLLSSRCCAFFLSSPCSSSIIQSESRTFPPQTFLLPRL